MDDAPGGIDLDQVRGLRAFVAAAQRLSFTRAADELGVSPQAVAAAVARLERSLGVRLLNRSTRSMATTPEGARLLPRAADALERLRDAAAAAAHGDTPAGRVSVSVAVSFARRFVLPELPRLLGRHPALAVELSMEDRRVDVVREGFDVAIRGGAVVDAGLVGRRVAAIRTVLVASPRYLQQAGVPRRPAELAAHRLIGLRFVSGAMQAWTFVGDDPTRLPPHALVVSDPEAVARAAELGLGIGAVGSHHVWPQLRAGRLKVVLADAFRPAAGELSIQYPHREHLAPRVRAVVEHLLAAWAKHPDLQATAAELKRHAA